MIYIVVLLCFHYMSLVLLTSQPHLLDLSLHVALGGLSVFGNRTKELAETAKTQIGEKASSAQQAIGETSTGKCVDIPVYSYPVLLLALVLCKDCQT